jgi:hypothetical protein
MAFPIYYIDVDDSGALNMFYFATIQILRILEMNQVN